MWLLCWQLLKWTAIGSYHLIRIIINLFGTRTERITFS